MTKNEFVETEVVETIDVVVENQDEQVANITEDAVEEVMEEVCEEMVTFEVAKTPIKIGEDVTCSADIAELAVLLNLTARQMLKLLNKDLIRGVFWDKTANEDITNLRYYMAEFEVYGFTTYTTGL